MIEQFPETLRALKQAADEARAAYFSYKRPDGLELDAAIAADLTEKRLLKASAAARAAYDQAADEYLAGAGGIR